MIHGGAVTLSVGDLVRRTSDPDGSRYRIVEERGEHLVIATGNGICLVTCEELIPVLTHAEIELLKKAMAYR